jgi:hypothetical protein
MLQSQDIQNAVKTITVDRIADDTEIFLDYSVRRDQWQETVVPCSYNSTLILCCVPGVWVQRAGRAGH